MSRELPENNSAEEPQDVPQAVSAVSEFQKRAQDRTVGTLITLPSGVVVRVARPSVSKMIAMGHVPSDVAQVIMSGNAEKASQSVGTKEFTKLMELQEIIAVHAVLEPKVVQGVANYDEGQISVEDLTDEDLSTILLYVQKGVTDLASFRS